MTSKRFFRGQSRGGDAVANDLLNIAKSDAVARIEAVFAHVSAVCDSPIERILVAQLLQAHWASTYATAIDFLVPPSGLLAHATVPPWPGIFVHPQIKIGAYRVDFIVTSTKHDVTRSVIVECDGYEFHDKTREQAQRDKARDRFLISQGYNVLRYTGSEIYNDSEAVVTEILEIVTAC